MVAECEQSEAESTALAAPFEFMLNLLLTNKRTNKLHRNELLKAIVRCHLGIEERGNALALR